MAIKIIQIGADNGISKEIELLKTINHINLVKYYGSSMNNEDIWIMMDFCGNGSIRKFSFD